MSLQCTILFRGLNFTIYSVLVDHMEQYKNQGDEISRHMPNKYSEQMSNCSKVVSTQRMYYMLCMLVNCIGATWSITF